MDKTVTDYIEILPDAVICTSPTPERETYFRVSYDRAMPESTRTHHIKATRNLVRKGLITSAFAGIQIHALETITMTGE